MKKKILAMLLCAAMSVILIAGCGTDSSKEDSTTETKSGEESNETVSKGEYVIKLGMTQEMFQEKKAQK